MALNYQPQGMAEGIYFNLSNDDYHKDPALSHSGMTKVLVSWQDYWVNSCHNPDKEEYRPTDAMKLGTRTGMLLLEPNRFREEYNTQEHPNQKGLYLSSLEMQKIRAAVNGVLDVPKAKSYFMYGYPEVTFCWRDKTTGVMLRARIDYLRTFGAIDFKRIAGVGPFAIGRAVKSQGLDIQNFLYLEAIKAGRAWLRGMKPTQLAAYAKREGVDWQWINAFMNDEDLLFRFLFQRSTPPYIWKIRELSEPVVVEGANATFKAIKEYSDGIKRFGIGAPEMGDGELGEVSQFHVPRRDYDYE